MCLDVAVHTYSAASQGPFELGCPEVTQALLKVHLQPSLSSIQDLVSLIPCGLSFV